MRRPTIRKLGAWLSRHPGAAGFTAGAAAMAIVTSGGIALAAIPSSTTGQYTGCVAKRTGAVRVIDFQAGKRCTKNETRIRWTRGWRYGGTWSSTRAYAVGDVVVQSGSSYLARQQSKGRAPSNSPAQWGLIAQAGSTGATGAQGPPGSVGLTYVQSAEALAPGGGLTSARALCPAGQSVTGGSVEIGIVMNSGSPLRVVTSGPIDTNDDADGIPNNGWEGTVIQQAAPQGYPFRVDAICTAAASVR